MYTILYLNVNKQGESQMGYVLFGKSQQHPSMYQVQSITTLIFSFLMHRYTYVRIIVVYQKVDVYIYIYERVSFDAEF